MVELVVQTSITAMEIRIQSFSTEWSEFNIKIAVSAFCEIKETCLIPKSMKLEIMET